MTSIADRIPGPPLAGAADAVARAAAPTAAISFPVLGGERELRYAIQTAGFGPLEMRGRVPVDEGANLDARARGYVCRKAPHA